MGVLQYEPQKNATPPKRRNGLPHPPSRSASISICCIGGAIALHRTVGTGPHVHHPRAVSEHQCLAASAGPSSPPDRWHGTPRPPSFSENQRLAASAGPSPPTGQSEWETVGMGPQSTIPGKGTKTRPTRTPVPPTNRGGAKGSPGRTQTSSSTRC